MHRDAEPIARIVPTWTVAVAVGVVSLVIRSLVLRDLLAEDPLFHVPVLDDRAYLDIARSMADGRTDPWFLAPLYPWLLWLAAVVLPLGMPLACGINVVLGAAGSVAATAAATSLHSRTAGFIAGLLHASCGAFVFQDVTPGQEPALSLLHLLALCFAVRLARRRDPRSAALLGGCAGIAVLGRGTSMSLLLLAAPVLLRSDRGAALRLAAACGAGLLLTLIPAAVGNASLGGGPTPLPWSGGPNLYAANGPDSRATVSFYAADLGADPTEMAARAASIANANGSRQLTPIEVSSWWTRRTWMERGDLDEFVVHLARKAALFWSAEERGSNHSALAERRFSRWLQVVPVHGWWLLAVGAAAWWVLRPRFPEVDGAAAAIAGTWLLLTIVFPVARFRLPVAGIATVLTGCAGVETSRGAVATRRLASAAAILATLGVVSLLPIRPAEEGTAHVNLAKAYVLGAGDRVMARAELQTAIALEPTNGPAHELLGRLDLESGEPASALQHFVAAAQDRRTRWSAQVAALPALVALQRLDSASSAARGLLSENRNDPELLANAALVNWVSGDRGTAAALLAKARALAPDHPAVRYAMNTIQP